MSSISSSIISSDVRSSVRTSFAPVGRGLWSFLTNTSDFTFARAGTQTFTDFEGLIKTAPDGVAAHVGSRMVENLAPNPVFVDGNTDGVPDGWIKAAGTGSSSITDGVCTQSASGERPFLESGNISVTAGDEIRIHAYIGSASSSSDFGMISTSGVSVSGVFPTFADFSVAGRYSTGVLTVNATGNLLVRVGLGISGGVTGDMVFSKPQVEAITGQANQAPSEFVERVQFFGYENGNTADGNGVVTEAQGLSVPVTNSFGRNEINMLGESSFTAAAINQIGGGTFVLSDSDRAATVTNPGGGRSFAHYDIDVVSGRTYCASIRSEFVSGGVGTLRNISTSTPTSSGDPFVNFNADTNLYQIVFTASASGTYYIRFGLGIIGAETVASTWVIREPNFRDVTNSVNQNAPSEVIDNAVGFLTSNNNTVSSNVVTELPASVISGPVRAYNSSVLYGDSFTNGPQELGTNLGGLAGIAFESKGVAGHSLSQIRAIMTSDVPRAGVNSVLIEGGVNDILGASVDPTAQMMADQSAMVAHAVANSLQYQVYTIGPWKSNASWTAEKQGWSDTYNQWIRDTYDPRRVTDMYSILEDPGAAETLLPAYDSGDGLHPNAAGFLAVDNVTAPLLSPEWMRGVLLETGTTTMTRLYGFPANGISAHVAPYPLFDATLDKGSDRIIFDFSDGTSNNYLRATYDQLNDQIHLKKRVSGGVEVVASTSAAELNYVEGDQLNIKVRAGSDGISLWIDELAKVIVSSGDAPADWSTKLTTINLVAADQAVPNLTVWPEYKTDSFMENLKFN